MKKYKKTRVILFSSLAVLLLTVLIGGYIYYQPKEAALVTNDVISTTTASLTYANTEEHVMVDQNPHYLWACSMKDKDCVYVRDYIIQPLSKAQDEGINDFSYIEFVDFAEAPDTLHYRATNWHINYFPAFLKVQNIEGKMEILSTLEWDKTDPFTTDDLKKWMYENGIWHSHYQVEEKIEQAIAQ